MEADTKREVRVHIDQQPYHSPNPTPGAALYRLANVPAVFDLYREVEGNREDRPVPNDETEVLLKEDEHFHSAKRTEYKLIVNKREYNWPRDRIDGAEIKTLAGSPADWVVNQKFPGPGNDPEIADDQKVDLGPDAPPPGIKRFTTRKPTTSPGQ